MINVKQYIMEYYPDEGEDLIVYDGLDEAFTGIGYIFHKAFVCYRKDKIIEMLMRDCMTYDEAIEYFEFNIAGLYAGERTPVLIEEIV
jgi:hypothetical protein